MLATLDPLLAAWAAEREPGEAFGDFLRRSGRLGEAAVAGRTS
jgi:sulfite reductase beta subunit-like hemoprotein